MLRRNLLKSLTTFPFLSVLKLQEKQEEKPYRTKTDEYANGSWEKYTYDKNSNQLTFEDSKGFWARRTYNQNGNVLTFERSDGYWSKHTYNQNGQELTLENSDGFWITFASDGKT